MPVTPIVAQQIAEAERVAQVLLSEIKALSTGKSSIYHLEMAESMLNRVSVKLSEIRVNQQLIHNPQLDPEGGDNWMYQRNP